jgi:signal transduction histidine kinase
LNTGATWQNTACTVVYVDEIQAKTSSNDVDTRIKVMLLLLLLMMLVVVMMMVKNDWDANQDCEDTR